MPQGFLDTGKFAVLECGAYLTNQKTQSIKWKAEVPATPGLLTGRDACATRSGRRCTVKESCVVKLGVFSVPARLHLFILVVKNPL